MGWVLGDSPHDHNAENDEQQKDRAAKSGRRAGVKRRMKI